MTKTEKLYDKISDLAGGGHRVEDLLNELMQAVRDDTAEDIAIELRDLDHAEAAEVVKLNFLG